MKQIPNFPKIHCPFVRKEFEINKEDWRRYGNQFQIGHRPKVYLAVDEINPGYEWVFRDSDVIACEKLDGSNVGILVENGKIVSVYNRKNCVDILKIKNGYPNISEAVIYSAQKGYIKEGLQYGEVIGPKIQGNPYQLEKHIWYPFKKAQKSLIYKAFFDFPRTYESWEEWFKTYLYSRFAGKRGKKIFAEGVVFYSESRRKEGKVYMAKLRRDMFKFYYESKIRIYGEIK